MSESQFRGAHKHSKACKFEDPLVELYTRQHGRVKVKFETYAGYQEATRCCGIWKYAYADEKKTPITHYSFGQSGQVVTRKYTIWSFTLTVATYEKFRGKWCDDE